MKTERNGLISISIFAIFQVAFACLIVCTTGSSHALPPVRLTDDEITVLDLTKDTGATIDFLDCQLRVEGNRPNYELVFSGGRLPIPLHAVKQIQDDGLVDVKVIGKLEGLPVVRLWLSYTNHKSKISTRTWGGVAPDGMIVRGFFFSILIDAPVDQVVSILQMRRSKLKVRHLPSLHNTSSQNVVAVVADVEDEVAGVLHWPGYGIDSWHQISPFATTVNYICGISKTLN